MDHRALVEWVDARLSRGNVSFLLPGDFSSFCPFQSFVAHYGSRGEVIPGISAHAAASAVLRRSFDLPGVSHATVLTSPRAYTGGGRGDFRDFARAGNTLVLYMNDLRLPRLVEELRAGYGAEVPIAIIEEVSCPGERVTVGTLETICDIVGDRDPFGVDSDQPEPSLALVVVGEALALDEDPSWWDRRYEKIWKPRGVR
jgi:precorrin-4/cobalt-precorrin-4 C11-methyltransferase